MNPKRYQIPDFHPKRYDDHPRPLPTGVPLPPGDRIEPNDSHASRMERTLNRTEMIRMHRKGTEHYRTKCNYLELNLECMQTERAEHTGNERKKENRPNKNHRKQTEPNRMQQR